jgi:hypothetical protein
MTALQIIGLIAFIVALAGVLGFLFQSGKDNTQQDQPSTTPEYTKEELDNIKLAEELYNKDLRPVVAKKAKTKPAPELEVVEPEFVAKVVETSKVLPPEATINVQAVEEKVKESKPEFPIDKPAKKKRKYYPKNKK